MKIKLLVGHFVIEIFVSVAIFTLGELYRPSEVKGSDLQNTDSVSTSPTTDRVKR